MLKQVLPRSAFGFEPPLQEVGLNLPGVEHVFDQEINPEIRYQRRLPVVLFGCPQGMHTTNQPVLDEPEVLVITIPYGEVHKCEEADFLKTYQATADLAISHKTTEIRAKQLTKDLEARGPNGNIIRGAKGDYLVQNLIEGGKFYVVSAESFQLLYESATPGAQACRIASEGYRSAVSDLLRSPEGEADLTDLALDQFRLHQNTAEIYRLEAPTEFFLKDRLVSPGGIILCNTDGGVAYEYSADTFDEDHKEIRPGVYRQTEPVQAVQASSDFFVRALDGSYRHGKAGDYVICSVRTPEDRSVVSRSMFERNYQPMK